MKKIDIKYIGVPNICFSLTEKSEKRDNKFAKQRKKRGFDDSETWSLNYTIARFIIPRLKRYLEIAPKVIVIEKQQKKKIKAFLRAMELIASDSINDGDIDKGVKEFPIIFRGLWW
jgi:hypothetical protein